MGNYGVLVGPNPPTSNIRPWVISHDGIEGIVSPLTLTDPILIVTIIALGLLIPPLTILHAWLIGQAYRYAFPIGEPEGAFNLALKVSGAITVCAAVAIFIWLTQEVIDFYLIVGVMTAITLLLSAGTIAVFVHRQGFTSGFILRIELATGLLSLIVPIGVTSTLYEVGWPIILTLIIGFICYRQGLSTHLENQSARTTLWQTDRLALELLILFLVMLLPLSALVFFVNRLFVPGAVASWASFLVPLISVAFVALYATVRGEGIVVKKTGTLQTDYHESPLFWNVQWWINLFWNTVKWLLGALGVSGVVYISQMLVYAWFVNLVK